MDNPETLATLGTHNTGRRLKKIERAIKNGQSGDINNIGRRLEKTEGVITNG